MDPATIRAVIDAVPSCAMLKHEGWPGLDKLSSLRRASATGGMRRIPILTGNGGLFLRTSSAAVPTAQ